MLTPSSESIYTGWRGYRLFGLLTHTPRVGHALRNLDDRSLLNRSPLARLAYVERLARERYCGHLLPRGLALRELLIACVERVASR